MISNDRPCDNIEPHLWHSHEMQVPNQCSGTTRCGDRIHDSHTIMETHTMWCRGICDCGIDGDRPHGHGDHK